MAQLPTFPRPEQTSIRREDLVTLGYQKHGLRFTPLNGKAPTETGWNTAPEANLETSRGWATEGNVGVRCGAASGGLVVIDDDTGTDAGLRALGLLDVKTLQVQTGKGRHVYLRLPEGTEVRNSVSSVHDHVDVRGEGGQVVYPGSVHPTTGTVYAFVDGFGPEDVDQIAPVPAELLRRLTAIETKRHDIAREGTTPKEDAVAVWNGLSPKTQARINESVSGRIISGAENLGLRPDGSGRNGYAYGLACDLRKATNAGVFDPEQEEDLRETIVEAYTYSLIADGGLDEVEARDKAENTVENGFRYVQGALDVTNTIAAWRQNDEIMSGLFGKFGWKPETADLSDPAVRDVIAAAWPLEALPTPIRTYVEALAAAHEIAPEMAASMVLAAFSTAVLGRCEVKLNGTHTTLVNLWLTMLATTGERKTTVLMKAMAPVHAHIREARKRFEVTAKKIAAELAVLRKQKERLVKDLAEQSKGDPANHESQMASSSAEMDRIVLREKEMDRIVLREKELEDKLRRDPSVIIDGDFSPEALVDVCRDTGGRAMLCSSEGGLWSLFAGTRFGKRNGSPNLDPILKGKGGNEDFTEVKRSNRSVGNSSVRISVPNMVVGVFNTCQPVAFDQMLSDPERRAELENLGIFGRLFVHDVRPMASKRTYDTPAVPSMVQLDYEHCVSRVCRQVFDRPKRLPLELSNDAHEWFRENVLLHYERQMASGEMLSGSRDIGNRIADNVLHLAALLHLMDKEVAVTEIDVDTVQRATKIGAYLLAATLKILDRKRVAHGGGSVEQWVVTAVARESKAMLLSKEAHAAYLSWFDSIQGPEQKRVDSLPAFSRALGKALNSTVVRSGHARASGFEGFKLTD